MTPENRREGNRKAAKARWAKWRAEHPEEELKKAAGALATLRRV
ncbi:MAG TPA: hypothetical protein VIY49_27335 [Bryobacteraceae bacterium]